MYMYTDGLTDFELYWHLLKFITQITYCLCLWLVIRSLSMVGGEMLQYWNERLISLLLIYCIITILFFTITIIIIVYCIFLS